ncbi:major facilitator superfamily domain-containing protein [Triangularia setosa]|uniref:Major facilitator superfamily domain-containing protein n=1 Tax=Triangularia setosa TaxID=2587417 RepID=A0AAN6VZR9_9PEZI|nr:major facilitator superfamily domain-containing protein [Podospora setosa]
MAANDDGRASVTTTEETPLLASSPRPSSPLPGHNDGEHSQPALTLTISKNNQLRNLIRPRVIVLTFITLFLIELGIGITVAPINAIMESIICRLHHPRLPLSPDHSIRRLAGGVALIDDPICKSPDVQSELAMLRGWAQTFECIPGILGAVPYGILSDRWGRRPVLALSLLGCLLSVGFMYLIFYFSDVVPLWLFWWSSAFELIGGGGQVLVAMLYTFVADVVPIDGRATVFLQLNALFLGSQMVAGPLGGIMMVNNPWIPLWTSLVIIGVANLLILAFPETLHLHGKKDAAASSEDDSDDERSRVQQLLHKIKTGLEGIWEFILGNNSVSLLIISMTFVILGRFVGEILLQYATERYRWSWSRASIQLVIRNAFSMVTLLVLMPFASWFCLQHLGMSAVEKDIWLGRWSGMTAIVGCLIIAGATNGVLFSMGLIWFALGSGITSVIRSLLNSLVEEHHVGTVNTLIGFMENVGMMAAGPLLAKSLSLGLELGGVWVGLPFVTAGLFIATSTAILWIFRLPRRPSLVDLGA